MIRHGDLFDALPTIDAESIDACVTDPPYGIGFMGREWDTFKPGTGKARRLMHPREREAAKRDLDAFAPESQIEYDYSVAGLRAFQEWTAQWAAEVFRVLKPGAYLVVCGAPRSHHRMMCGLEDAGFVVRDCFAWLFGSGFPKNFNLGDGKGTALKPAHEPIALAWKPFKGTISACHERHGTAALNIDSCRIGADERTYSTDSGMNARRFANGTRPSEYTRGRGETATVTGRWPANVLLDEEAAAMLDEQTGELTTGQWPSTRGAAKFQDIYQGGFTGQTELPKREANAGGASRFYKIVAPDCILCGMSRVDHATMRGCKTSSASSAARRSRTTRQIIDAIAPNHAHGSLVERLALAAPSAESLCERCATCIVLALVEIRCSGSLPSESRAFQGSIPRSKSSTLIPHLASFAGLWGSIDTIPTTASLSMLFGSVCHAIENCTRPASPESDSDQQRFLYSAKPSREERDMGCHDLAERPRDESRKEGNPGGDNPRNRGLQPRGNFHPTVKPIELMRWLVKLVTPIGGVVLDPFTGSGTTGMACRYEDRQFIGIEREADYIRIAEARIAAVAPLFSSEVSA